MEMEGGWGVEKLFKNIGSGMMIGEGKQAAIRNVEQKPITVNRKGEAIIDEEEIRSADPKRHRFSSPRSLLASSFPREDVHHPKGRVPREIGTQSMQTVHYLVT